MAFIWLLRRHDNYVATSNREYYKFQIVALQATHKTAVYKYTSEMNVIYLFT